MRWNLGRGSKVRIWKDCWCGEGVLEQDLNTPTYPLPNPGNTTVDYLLDGNGDWDLMHINNLMPRHVVVEILKIQPPRNRDVEDNPRWVKAHDGDFSIASAYEIIVDHHSQERDWGWIWKLKVPQKLKSFVWVVLHEKLLTNHMRQLRGTIKLNTDGSTRRNGGGGGFGGLFRDETSSWISGYYEKLEICTSLEAELWAIYKGLTIILQRGMNQVVIETDAEQVVQLLSEELREQCLFRGVVEDARIIMRDCDCTIQHIKREANICADALAKLGENQPVELPIVNDPPAEIRNLLIADIVHLSQEVVRTYVATKKKSIADEVGVILQAELKQLVPTP
ncbi:unnamed protein product [Camellia sinensis]